MSVDLLPRHRMGACVPQHTITQSGPTSSRLHCKAIDCTLQKRERCLNGSYDCGPCVAGLEESSDGQCVEPSYYPEKGKSAVPIEESNIDFLASLLEKQGTLQLADSGNTTSLQPPPPPPNVSPSGRNEKPGGSSAPHKAHKESVNDALLLGVVVASAVAGLLALLVAAICWCRMRREMKLAEKTDYPAFKSASPPPYEKASPGDKKLAQNAQMYHYQHQKQQMLSMEKNKEEPKHTDSAVTSDEENEDGDFTVYECPGLAPTGEMEVKNPLFDDSSLHHPSQKTHEELTGRDRDLYQLLGHHLLQKPQPSLAAGPQRQGLRPEESSSCLNKGITTKPTTLTTRYPTTSILPVTTTINRYPGVPLLSILGCKVMELLFLSNGGKPPNIMR
ncbi:neural proliferation differentiation and control protein 1 [Pelodytes ibericus]